MNDTEQIRARLAALAAAEEATPSRVWAPVDHPGPCRPPFLARTLDCDCSRCCAAAPHEAGCSKPDTPQCTCPDDAEYHLADCPECEEESRVIDQFTDEQINLCHKATEFDHECVVCRTLGQETERPDEAIPGTDY